MNLMKHLRFYLLRNDLTSILADFEGSTPIQYARMGQTSSAVYDRYGRGAEIPNLGTAPADAATACPAYLVCSSDTKINLRQLSTIIQPNTERTSTPIGRVAIPRDNRSLQPLEGAQRFAIDQLLNPDTAVLTPGGRWKQDIVLTGSFATASQSDAAQRLMRRFQASLRKTCMRVRGSYVGPEAMVLLKSGARLTDAEQCPREFDLTLP